MEKKRTILVAEDDGDDAFIFQNACTYLRLEHHVRFVKDGQEAIDYLKGKPPYTDRKSSPLPDLLVVDLKMPRVDGFDLLKWVRATPELKELPVIVFSGSEYASDKERAAKLGATDYFVKPGWGDSMLEIVRQISSRWLHTTK